MTARTLAAFLSFFWINSVEIAQGVKVGVKKPLYF